MKKDNVIMASHNFFCKLGVINCNIDDNSSKAVNGNTIQDTAESYIGNAHRKKR